MGKTQTHGRDVGPTLKNQQKYTDFFKKKIFDRKSLPDVTQRDVISQTSL